MQTWIKANIGKLIERFGGVALKLITAAEFAALETKDPATLYAVTDSEADTVALYLGDKFIIGDRVSTVSATRAAKSSAKSSAKKKKRRSK